MKKSNETVNEKESGFFTILFDLFRSLKLTIFLLILLAILSIIGTLITQNATRSEYIQRYGLGLYEVLNFFNLFDMYHSWWFRAILLLLVINLITCSLHRFPGVWRQISHKPSTDGLEDSMLKALPYVEKVQSSKPGRSQDRREYPILFEEVVWESEADGDRISDYPLFRKRKILEIGSLHYPFKPSHHLNRRIDWIPVWLQRFCQHLRRGNGRSDLFERGEDEEIPKPLGFSVRCDDFNITYYDLPGRKEKHVKEYTSIITILENGKEVLKEDRPGQSSPSL